MRNSLMTSVATLAIVTVISGPSAAADLAMNVKAAPVPALSCMWCGLYAGGHVGYGWSRHDTLVSNPDDFINSIINTDINKRASGLALGLQAGYNWQLNNFVFGIEGDGTLAPWQENIVRKA